MKKLILLILLFPAIVFAQADHIGGAATSDMEEYGAAAGADIGELGGAGITGACSNCPTVTGTLTFCYDGEHATDEDTATGVSGNLAGSVSGATINGSYALCGSYGVLFDATHEYVEWTATQGTDIDSAEGTAIIGMGVPTSWTGANYFFTVWKDVNNNILARVNADDTITVYHESNGAAVSSTSTTTVPTASAATGDTETTIYIAWSDTGNKIGIKIGSNAWEEETKAVVVFNSAADAVQLGDYPNSGLADEFWLDNFRIYSDYKHE